MDALFALMGWFSAACFLLAYGLVSHGKLDGASRTFQLLNLAGCVGLGLDTLNSGAYAAATSNTIWALIALSSLVRASRECARAKPAAAEGGP